MRTWLASIAVVMMLPGCAGAGAGATSTSPPYVAPTEKLPNGEFDRASAAAALGPLRDLTECRGADGSGEGHFIATFNNDGSVTKAVVDTGPFIGTPAGDCVQQKVLKARIRPFDGPAVRVGRAFVIR